MTKIKQKLIGIIVVAFQQLKIIKEQTGKMIMIAPGINEHKAERIMMMIVTGISHP